MPPRKSRNFKDFPDIYTTALEAVGKSGEWQIVMPSMKEAQSRRHDLYRYFRALFDAQEEQDPLALELAAVARNTTISIMQTTDESNPRLVLRRNSMLGAAQ